MTNERDEDFWYGPGWPDLRQELVKLCLRHADELLETLADPTAGKDRIEEACRAWFDAAGHAIVALLKARPAATRWRHALGLLILPQHLAASLAKDRVLRSGGDEERRRAALVVGLGVLVAAIAGFRFLSLNRTRLQREADRAA